MVYVWHMQLLNKWKLLFWGENFKILVIQDMTSEIQFKQLLNLIIIINTAGNPKMGKIEKLSFNN